jgi:hypothetical protein
MTDAKHTPGPWVSNRFDNVFPSIFDAEDPEGGNIFPAGLEVAMVKSGPQMWDAGVRKANARLIAAAPDMLAALCEVIADIEAYCEDHMSNNPTDVTVGLPRLRAAVYKATEKEAK